MMGLMIINFGAIPKIPRLFTGKGFKKKVIEQREFMDSNKKRWGFYEVKLQNLASRGM